MLLASTLLLIPADAFAAKPGETVTGKVVALHDGDTLIVRDDKQVQHKIRLAGIDAPERKQAYGKQARENLSGKVFGQTVRVEVVDIDRFHHEVGRLYLGDRFINLEMVKDGCAWRFPAEDKPGEFTAAQADARAHRRGLWTDPTPESPWEFRRWRRAVRTPLAPLK